MFIFCSPDPRMDLFCPADKNQGNLQEAEENFKEILNAYEVLSDKHERAWYASENLNLSLFCRTQKTLNADSIKRCTCPAQKF